MSNPFDGELLSTIIKLAKAEAYEQLNDPYDREIGIYLQLDLRDRSKRGGRYLGEPPNAPGINNDNREGEYKLWDEENLDVFFKTDGNPTAARALLLAMKGYHNIGERFIVYMGFTGIIDQGFDPPTPRRIRLRAILKPLKIWDTIAQDHPDFEQLLGVFDREVITDICIPFFRFSNRVVKYAPHMLRPGYTITLNNGRKVRRFSWARILVMLFLPETKLMEQLIRRGLATAPPQDWYRRALKEVREDLAGCMGPKMRASLRQGWSRLSAGLHLLYETTSELHDLHEGDDSDCNTDSSLSSMASDDLYNLGQETLPRIRRRPVADDNTDGPDHESNLAVLSTPLQPLARVRSTLSKAQYLFIDNGEDSDETETSSQVDGSRPRVKRIKTVQDRSEDYEADLDALDRELSDILNEITSTSPSPSHNPKPLVVRQCKRRVLEESSPEEDTGLKEMAHPNEGFNEKQSDLDDGVGDVAVLIKNPQSEDDSSNDMGEAEITQHVPESLFDIMRYNLLKAKGFVSYTGHLQQG